MRVRQLRWTGLPQRLPSAHAQATDAQLLFRYTRLGEESAFETLIYRHGPLVWGVCRRLLGCSHDSEDAFQATFVVLARKAGGLRDGNQLSAWLHGVARRSALHVRSKRRNILPLPDDIDRDDASAEELAWKDCQPVIDEAISELPVHFRIPFLLFHAEGLPAPAIARRLGCPEGTIESRLHRARQRLRFALSRKGLTLSAGAVLGSLALTVPSALAAGTLSSILSSTIPTLVATLAQGVISAMTWMKLTTTTVIVTAFGLAGTGAGLAWAQRQGDAPKANQSSETRQKNELLVLQNQVEQLRNEASRMRDEIVSLEKGLRASAAERAKVEQVLVKAMKDLQDQAVQSRGKVSDDDRQRQIYQEMAMKKTEEEQTRKRMALERAKQKEQMIRARERMEQEVTDYRAQLAELRQRVPSLGLEKQEEILFKEIAARKQSIRMMQQQLVLTDNKNDGEKNQASKNRQLLELETQALKESERHYQEYVQFQNKFDALLSKLKMRERLLLEIEERLLRSELEVP